VAAASTDRNRHSFETRSAAAAPRVIRALPVAKARRRRPDASSRQDYRKSKRIDGGRRRRRHVLAENYTDRRSPIKSLLTIFIQLFYSSATTTTLSLVTPLHLQIQEHAMRLRLDLRPTERADVK
jgi:hypothetical protein